MPKPFDYSQDFSMTDFRKHPEKYQVGKGEQGVLVVEPYKSEILPYWRFKSPDVAEASAKAIMKLFRQYKKQKDFVGMDMSRKFLQMGYTRSRRYANHKSGRKYGVKDKTDQPKKFHRHLHIKMNAIVNIILKLELKRCCHVTLIQRKQSQQRFSMSIGKKLKLTNTTALTSSCIKKRTADTPTYIYKTSSCYYTVVYKRSKCWCAESECYYKYLISTLYIS